MMLLTNITSDVSKQPSFTLQLDFDHPCIPWEGSLTYLKITLTYTTVWSHNPPTPGSLTWWLAGTSWLGKGPNKNCNKEWSFAIPPTDLPPLGYGLFLEEKNLPPFFLNLRPLKVKKNYTWSHLKIYLFSAFIMASMIAFHGRKFTKIGQFQSYINSIAVDISESLQTKCKTCFWNPTLFLNGFW